MAEVTRLCILAEVDGQTCVVLQDNSDQLTPAQTLQLMSPALTKRFQDQIRVAPLKGEFVWESVVDNVRRG